MIMGDSTSVEQVLPVKTPPLGKAARQSLIWSGAFTIFRDVAQFVTMIFLVRIVSPWISKHPLVRQHPDSRSPAARSIAGRLASSFHGRYPC
jgi:hypothetical protein